MLVISFFLQQLHERELSQLEVGCKVIAKHRNTRYYEAEVLEREDQVFYEVDFDDGSFSNDLFPEDIHVSGKFIGPVMQNILA